MVDLYAQQRTQRIHERRRWAHDMREPGLRDELAHALWELHRLKWHRPADLQTYALRRVVMVQRRELMELREEKDRLAGILDQVRNADRWQAQDEWERLCAVADHEEAGMVEELALSDTPGWDRLSDSALLDFDNSLRTLRIHDGVVIPDPEPDED